MKTKIVYVCEYCGNQYDSVIEAAQCEADHLGLTLKQLSEYNDLLLEERKAGLARSYTNNQETRDRLEKAIQAVLVFEKEHNMPANTEK